MARLLVIAADAELRRSLQFALEAEGYVVTCRASIGARELPADYDCTVVDHHVVGADQRMAKAFFEAFAPVILLANAPVHALSTFAFRTVQKPQLGPALSAAIQEAVAHRAATT